MVYKIFFLLLVVFFQMGFSKECLSDYKVSSNNLKHSLSAFDLNELNNLANNNDPLQGWKKLGELGDDYAFMAYQVLEAKGENKVFYNLIKNHWLNVVSKKSYYEKFSKVAALHFNQYIEILNLGLLPDSDQILLSYLSATKRYGLPELVVFDAAWILSGYNQIKSWEELNHLTNDRIVTHSKVCLTSSSLDAGIIIFEDLTKTSLETILGTAN